MLKFLKNYTLPIAMLIGVVGYKLFSELTFCLSTLIFFMLFFTFCKINPLDLRLHRWHWLLLIGQLLLTVVSYYALCLYDAVLAQSIMLCFLMPAATASPIIAGKLGGSIQSLTSFIMLSNIATAIVVPIFFPLINPQAEIDFVSASTLILMKVGPLLLAPFLLAWLLRVVYDAVQKRKKSNKRFALSKRWGALPFYLWAMSLVILMAEITRSLIEDEYDVWIVTLQAIGALVACIMQFFAGKIIGEHFPSVAHGQDYQDVLISEKARTDDTRVITRISAGQAFGQKNTTLGVWLAQTYLNPLSAFGAAAYIVWQNIFNSWQLARAAKGKKV